MPSNPTTASARDEAAAGGVRRPLLWVLLVVALAVNGITSLAGLPIAVSATAGVLALALGALLVRDHYRRRARP
jgi:Flp pilus assembly protein TadB